MRCARSNWKGEEITAGAVGVCAAGMYRFILERAMYFVSVYFANGVYFANEAANQSMLG